MARKHTTLIIPTHNEEDIIDRALASLERQSLGELTVSVIIIPNGCIDRTAEVTRRFATNSANKNISWRIEELPDGHRARALNHGVSLSDSDIVMYLNPDCVIEEGAIKLMYELLTSKEELIYIGMLEEPDLSFLIPGTKLYQTVQLLWYNRKVSNSHPPSGRFVAFKRESIQKFPEIHSEDTWASLYSYKTYGPLSIMVVKDQTVKYIPYKNWVDFMRVESRYFEGTYEVYSKFPDLKEADNKRISENKISDERKIELFTPFCQENQIDPKFVLELKDIIMPLVIENTRLMRQISNKGTWEIVK